MRVLYLNHNVVGSGTYFRAFHLGRQLAKRGHQVTLVTTSRTARFRTSQYMHEGVEVIESPDLLTGRGRTGWDPFNTLVRIKSLRSRDFEIVHAFDSRPAVIFPALAVARRTEARLFIDWADWWGRGGWIHDRSGWAVRTFFGPVETWFEEGFRQRAHGVTAISDALRDRTIALGIAPEKVARIGQGCDSTSTPVGDRRAARTRLGIPADALIVMHLGLLTPGDLVFLRAAFAFVRGHSPTAQLVLVGRTSVKAAGNGYTHVTGEVTNETLQDWLAAADVCVIPSRDTIGNRGRWPSKLNDYLSAGRAVVMPQVGDAAIAIARYGAGRITKPDAEDFGAGIASALKDEAWRANAEVAARKLAETELAWPKIAAELISFYEERGVDMNSGSRRHR